MIEISAPPAPPVVVVQELEGKSFLLVGSGVGPGDQVVAVDRYGRREQRQIIEILPGHRARSIPVPSSQAA